ncbi:MAG: DMT family transporter [Eubacteriales bacterium]|nr:DMT family transporter [Eubacteriales bacterium]
MWAFLIALASGALMSIQGVLNTELTKQTSIWVSAGWVQLTAFFTCAVLWFFADRSPAGALLSVRPWYMLAGGLIGAFITFTVIRSMDGLGPARATLLIVVTQIIAAYGIELFGLFGVEKAAFEWKKLIGALIAIGGIVVFRW